MKKILFLLFVIVSVIGCSKSDEKEAQAPLKVSKQEFKLFVGEKVDVGAVSAQKITFTSENDLIAAVDDKGVISAKLVGETTIKVSDGKTSLNLKVVVSPKNTTFEEPYISNSKEDVLSHFKGKTTDIDDKGEGLVLYLKEGSLRYRYIYIFKEEAKNGVQLSIPITSYSSDEIISWLKERYFFYERKEDQLFFFSPDRKTVALLKVESKSVNIFFFKS
ncbi:Ig-like domain (group 2) [Capnocytophaga haemolytica]|uniref:BIG2 domain-containing protein n=1 Tax=Capnocytophaga haemolytica TaxID=45243 RepID=A0AAX2GVP6_9FLAO|nr:Ig-like domain-containing protein [Capnocytophaga haemolytica]AMD85085.1 hypothetical protein AXF12_05860 [Capnocytophaga haemolytica]SFN68742.1 Ig-like domain (group 2) [Capnocytophaga haemolytica]SNV05134.1 Uncharacterised protein [Capnocytophaga haemolytica]